MNTRPPPPQGTLARLTLRTPTDIRQLGRPPFMSKLSKTRNLRVYVAFTSFLTAVWSLFGGIGFYRNIGPYNDNGAPKLATISIVIGSVYMGVFIIGAYGVSAALSRKLKLIRIFAYLSALAVLMVAGINLLRVIVHFTMRATILQTCANDATGRVYVYGGWWGPVYSGSLTSTEATQFCNHYYDRDSWSLVLGFLCLTIVGIFFSLLAFAYLRQTLDPSSPDNVIYDPHRSAFSPAHYNPPFNAPGYSTGYGYNNYPAPNDPPPAPYPGPPDGKPPGYTGRGFPDEEEDMQKKPRDYDEEAPRTGDLRH